MIEISIKIHDVDISEPASEVYVAIVRSMEATASPKLRRYKVVAQGEKWEKTFKVSHHVGHGVESLVRVALRRTGRFARIDGGKK